MKTEKIFIPKISDEVLAQRMKQIRWVTHVMQGIDGKIYRTLEKNKKFLELFFVESKVNPRTQAFNFDEDRKLKEKASELKELLIKDIFVKIGVFYGHCKITFAEVMSQIPDEIVPKVVAFALNPEKDYQILNKDYQSASIIYYEQGEKLKTDKNLPSVKDIVKPVNLERAELLKNKVRPIINYPDKGLVFIVPSDINSPFMEVTIYTKIFCNDVRKTNEEERVSFKVQDNQKISIYQPFKGRFGANFYHPDYAEVISQIADELIGEKTVGFQYLSTKCHKTKEGVVHVSEFVLIESVSA